MTVLEAPGTVSSQDRACKWGRRKKEERGENVEEVEVANEKKRMASRFQLKKPPLKAALYLCCPARRVHDDLVTLLRVEALDGGADVGLHRRG